METIKTSKSIEKKLPLGRMDKEKAEKVDKLAEQVKKTKELERNNATEDAKEEAKKEVFKTLDTEYESVEEIIKASEDTTKTEEERDKAKMDLDILAKAVIWQMKNGEESEKDLLGKGVIDVTKIEDHLSDEYKGLGKTIVKSVIKSEEIRGIVKEMSGKMEYYSNKSTATRELAREELKDAMKKIMDLPAGVREAYEDDVAMVMAYLAEEAGVYDERGGRGNERANVMYYDDEGNPISEGKDYRISKDNLAHVMKNGMFLRWDDGTPPEWYEKLEKTEKAKVRIMIQMYLVASGVRGAGKDLDKIIGNRENWGFSHEDMNAFLDHDMKSVMSKLLKDLCEMYVDQNGVECLRYKEKCYLYSYEKKCYVDRNGVKVDREKEGARLVECDEREVAKGNAVRTIDQDVFNDLGEINKYKDKLAIYLAEKNGGWDDEKKKIPNVMNRMMAITAWNTVYGHGDSSIWDRTRALPTWDGVICDAIRTLNAEYKMKGKLMIEKSGVVKSDIDLLTAEDFGGNTADYLLRVMKMERDLGKPLDGKKLMRDKIVDGEMSFLRYKTYYGLLDFVNQGRDLKKEGIGGTGKDSLGKLLLHYNDTTHDVNEKMFREKAGQVTFMNEHRDSLEGSILVNRAILGKAEFKDFGKFVREIKGKLGMTNGIEFNGESPFAYARDPKFWRDLLVGSIGFDDRILSSEWVRIKKTETKPGQLEQFYNLYLYDLLVKQCGLTSSDVNINAIMRLCGVDVSDKEKGYGFGVTMRDWRREGKGRRTTERLEGKQEKTFKFGLLKGEMKDIVNKVNAKDEYKGYADFDRMRMDFNEAIARDDKQLAQRLAKAIFAFTPRVGQPINSEPLLTSPPEPPRANSEPLLTSPPEPPPTTT